MSFTFNNINCETLGMFVEEYPDRPFPQRKVTAYSVAGRNGDLLVDEGAYTNVIQEYKVFVKGSGGNTLQQNLSVIGAWLLGTAGYQKLRDDYDTSIYRLARCVNAVEFLNSLNRFGRATIQFDCCPQRYLLTPEILSIITNNGHGDVRYPANGLLPAYPIIKVTGITSLMRNIEVDIHNQGGSLVFQVAWLTPPTITTLMIDMETQSVVDEATGRRPDNTFVSGAWDKCDANYMISLAGIFDNQLSAQIETRRYASI